MYIIFDTETTGLPRNWNAPISDTDNWPRCVQIAWQLHDEYGKLIVAKDYLITPQGFDIPFDAEKIHGISTELALQNGTSLLQVLNEFSLDVAKAKFLVGQNLAFDLHILGCEFFRLSLSNPLEKKAVLDTCTEKTAELCEIPGGRGGKFKLPTLSELHQFLFQVGFEEAHNATADVEATSRCFFELIRINHFGVDELQADVKYLEQFKIQNPLPFQAVGLKHTNLKLASQQLKDTQLDSTIDKINQNADIHVLDGISFSHLHNHTQFSILQSTIDIKSLVKAAIANNMPAVALTDMGNMMAAFQFEQVVASENAKILQKRKEAEEKGEVFSQNVLLPIIGCEFNVCQDRNEKTNKDNGYQIVFLAKNKNGYHNLAKLSSIAYTDGFYYVPRIDKKDVEKYKEDVIVLSGNLYGEIPNLLLNVGEQQAEEALLWWKSQFQDDFYLEVMRHQQENEDWVNTVLLKLAAKHQVKLVATNNTFYIQKEEANSQDVLLCIKDAELLNTPKGRGRGFRFGLENEEYYFKSTAEMKQLFADLPEAIINTNEIVAKCEPYTLSRDILLPAFDIPEEFQDLEDAKDGGKRGENNFLRHITYEGAKERYGTITPEISERIDFELETIANTGYPGYFLIVHDFCKAAREMDVLVGPGRGSAAGSVVAYCCRITNIDPLKYDLLFERFLNPERVSMPDIDIDFEDEGRGKVMEYVINKYGANQVAQIITYGTMAAKSSIRDAARVLDLPLYEADRIAKLVPDISLEKIFTLKDDELHKKLGKEEDFNRARELQQIAKGKDLAADVVNEARRIEGTIRNTGIHACGVIITPDDITNFVPVATAKDSEMWCTQFDNTVVETAGLLKMDFLGLKTLTILKDAVKNIQKSKNITIDIEKIPIDDQATYELFQRGDTVGIFQYESPGMQKYLRELKPTVFADLIAMNALYRPGPIEYIPSFIKRKNGLEEITYDLEASEEYLKETYGITVYQEQVMLLSQKLANFSKGEADVLRKAMGKKKLDVLEKMKPKFIQQASNLNGHAPEKLEKIWRDWEAFASYAFNKSHSTCYAWIAYQTAYLKANYPAEYMASVLSNNMNDIKSVGMFMAESKSMEIEVLGPDVNESDFKFTVNKNGAIRFGLGAIKGLGSNPINNIIENRTGEKGLFTSVFDLSSRVNLRACNKKAFESMALAGCFDSLGITRAQCFAESASSGKPFLETIMKYGASIQEASNSSQFSMFGDIEMEAMPVPELPKVEPWSSIVRLNKEKEVIGIFISGHPLDDYALEMKCYCNMDFATFSNPESIKPATIKMAGIASLAEHRISKRGNQFGLFELEDFSGTARFYIDGENYFKYKHLLIPGLTLFVTGNFSKSKFNPNEQRFNINTIELLENLKNKDGKNLCISLETALVNNELIGSLDSLFKAYPGKCGIQFTMNDTLTNVVLQLTSRNIAVSLDSNLLKELTKLSLDFKLIEN